MASPAQYGPIPDGERKLPIAKRALDELPGEEDVISVAADRFVIRSPLKIERQRWAVWYVLR